MKKIFVVIITGIILSIALLISGTVFLLRQTNTYYAQQLVLAIKEENIEEINRILDKRPECVNTYPSYMNRIGNIFFDLNTKYPLSVACRNGNIEIVKLLVERGADVNNNDGWTALSYAYDKHSENWYEIAVYLIENGASLEYRTSHSGEYFAILEDIIAPTYTNPDENEIYLSFVYAIERIDKSKVDWASVFRESIVSDRTTIIEYLLQEKYCNINSVYYRSTALIYAVERSDDINTIRLLLEYGADVMARDENWKTAYDYAIENGDTEIIELLSSYMDL